MKPLVISTPNGTIPTWRHCDCGSETYAYLSNNGKNITCGACTRQFESKDYVIKFMTIDPDRRFEETING